MHSSTAWDDHLQGAAGAGAIIALDKALAIQPDPLVYAHKAETHLTCGQAAEAVRPTSSYLIHRAAIAALGDSFLLKYVWHSLSDVG